MRLVGFAPQRPGGQEVEASSETRLTDREVVAVSPSIRERISIEKHVLRLRQTVIAGEIDIVKAR